MSQGPGIRPSIHALPHSLIDEIARYGRGRDGMIPLWFGEGDVPTPDFVMDAADLERRDYVAWVRLPQRVPLGFHGNWVSDRAVPPPM